MARAKTSGPVGGSSRPRDLLHDSRGQVAIIFAFVAFFLILLIGGLVDASFAIGGRERLQDAVDEAGLAVSVATAQNPNQSTATLQAIAQNVLQSNYTGGTPTITDFHVCAPVQNDCTDNSQTMKMGTVALAVSAPTNCLFGGISTFCVSTSSTQTVSASTLTTIGFGTTVEMNVVMDSSASMIVGATPADVTTIATWVTNNWNAVKPGDPPPNFPAGDNPPCAFACHDVGGPTTPADIAQGLTNAHSAGATTRFDVMIAAAQQLITHVQTLANSNTHVAKNTYLFNIMSFDTALHQYGATDINTFAAAQTAVMSVTPGLDTYLSSAMGQLVTQVGINGTGASAASPLKFVILVTDGLQSDRGNNWGCSSWINDAAWNYYPTCVGGYATGISLAQCQQMKSNGIVLAVLETPYVPLTGQSPHVAPYEKTVRKVIFPGGPNTPSIISAALQSCATDGYYFQATNSSDIATGFTTLTDEFLSRSAVITK
ncbi:MAG: TadE/TadG family type IV pilus assembly protein [Caulobacterales bacterium]